MVAAVFQIYGGIQCYKWGKVGSKSEVARFAQATPSFALEETKPYAELWMGTHPSCPSVVASSGENLRTFLTANPGLLGKQSVARYGPDLPFLFKVLAINKALSIQAHPDKVLAERLHHVHPDVYKDANHKPEMAIAITPFTGFCGFLPLEAIATYLSVVPEVRSLIPEEIVSRFMAAVNEGGPPAVAEDAQSALRSVFSVLMKSDEDSVREVLKTLVARYNSGDIDPEEQKIKDVVMTLSSQYPGDVGVLCSFLLNVVRLEPRQAIFLKANEPHAYISGDIVETMATSDNVVRAGLTPKLRDVPTLLSMLTYSAIPAAERLMVKTHYKKLKRTIVYDPPIDEFSVLVTELEVGEEEEHPAINGPSIFIVTQSAGLIEWNSGREVHHFKNDGEIFFVGAGTNITFKASGPLVVYRAFVEAD
ncbi:mannose-6-phosphate isomerase [Cantharellus anzutake]|uniref:mannose-6-phosphate isomerase n=1 Tax=Cantharellus anzutake TaxID=1750568 RepID=UPI0019076CF9|nr:mannose-6-phosphate isomerase [Cantharellus anzutake]KAF8335011.1 mannose-6-phosphate isomerase [Cantharellus anzutake]